MKTRAFIITAAILLISSCAKEFESVDSSVQELTFTASAEGRETRTVLQNDGTSLWWSPGDSINIFYGSTSNGKFVAQNSEPAAMASFRGYLNVATGTIEAGNEAKDFWGVYPYSSDRMCNESSVTISIPTTQQPVAGTFPSAMFPSVAKSSSLNLAFYNICGGLKFSVYHNDIKSVTFKTAGGQAVAGDVTVGVGSDGKPFVESVISGSSSVTITPSDGKCFQTGKDYYAVLLPAVLSDGFSVTYQRGKSSGTYTKTSSVEIKRSNFGVLANADKNVTFVMTDDIEISAIISDGNTIYCESDGDEIYLIDNDGYNDMTAVVNRVETGTAFHAFMGSPGWAGGWSYILSSYNVDCWNFYHNTGAGYHRFSYKYCSTGKTTLSVESGTPKVNGITSGDIWSSRNPGDGTLTLFGFYDKEYKSDGGVGNMIYSFTIDGIAFTPVLHWDSDGQKYYPTWRYTYKGEKHYMRLIQGSPSYEKLISEDVDIKYESGTFNIYTGAGMKVFADIVNGTNSVSVDGYTGTPNNLQSASGTLMDNIDLSDYLSWTPIGATESQPYSGVFSGNGYGIRNLTIDTSSGISGLFGVTQGASISDVSIESGTISCGGTSGSIVGYAVETTISSCSNAVAVNSGTKGGSGLGGIVGEAQKTIIDKCANTADVYTYSGGSVGGIVGAGSNGTIVRNCYNTGSVTGGHYSLGGINGMMFDSYIYNCYNQGKVSHTGATSYGNSVGGIMGTLYRGACINCYNNGTVSGGYFNNASGIVAFASDTNGYSSSTHNLYSISYGYYLSGCCLTTIYCGYTSNIYSYASNLTISNSVSIGGKSYNNVLAALNAWVNANNGDGKYLSWSLGTDGLPSFAQRHRNRSRQQIQWT